MGRKNKHREWLDYVLIALAMMIGSVGLGVFLLPNHITMGGVGGIASILYWGLHIPVTVSYLVINVALLLIAFWILGWKFCAKTIYAVVVFTGTLSVVQYLMGDNHFLKDQPFMATVVGAFFMGSSSGLGLACNASTGGSDTIAAMVNKYHDISLGHIVFICDLIIITSSYLVLRDWEMVIYGYVFVYLRHFYRSSRQYDAPFRSVLHHFRQEQRDRTGHQRTGAARLYHHRRAWILQQ